MKTEFLTKSDVLYRGWTKTLIEKYLGEPDQTSRNPRYRNAAPCQLFSVKRVETIEISLPFIEAKKKSDKRSLSALTAVQSRQDKLLKQISGLKITVKLLNEDVIFKRAIKAYNDFNVEQMGKFAGLDSDPDFLKRICVNFIRHNLTIYDQGIEVLCGQVGKEKALSLLRKRISKEIKKAYPHLADECNRQQQARSQELSE